MPQFRLRGAFFLPDVISREIPIGESPTLSDHPRAHVLSTDKTFGYVPAIPIMSFRLALDSLGLEFVCKRERCVLSASILFSLCCGARLTAFRCINSNNRIRVPWISIVSPSMTDA